MRCTKCRAAVDVGKTERELRGMADRTRQGCVSEQKRQSPITLGRKATTSMEMI